jgi:hypothetical protein
LTDKPPMDEQIAEINAAVAPVQLYSNALAAKGAPYDITLVFGRRTGVGDVDWQAEVTMSWEHARSMLVALEKVVKEYETKMGEIRDIDSVVETEVGGR